MKKRNKILLFALSSILSIGLLTACGTEDKELTGFMMPASDEAGYAVAFPKDSQLTEEFNESIAEMKEDGTLDELILKWFGTGDIEADDQEEDTEGEDVSGEKEKLVMGTSADYPPFEYIDTASGSDIIGFDIEIANYIADYLGFEYTIENMDFNGLVEAVRTGRVDFVLSGMTPTDERRENVDFSDNYYEGNQMIVTLKDSGIETIEDLDGKKVGVQLGSIQAEEAEGIEGAIIEQRDKIPQLIQELKNKQIDAIILEDTVANGYIKGE